MKKEQEAYRNALIYSSVIAAFGQWIWKGRKTPEPKWNHTEQKVESEL